MLVVVVKAPLQNAVNFRTDHENEDFEVSPKY